jgi:hypothetical protein
VEVWVFKYLGVVVFVSLFSLGSRYPVNALASANFSSAGSIPRFWFLVDSSDAHVVVGNLLVEGVLAVMRSFRLWAALFVCFLGLPCAFADTSIAVLPYLSLGVTDADAASISEVLAREVAARTNAKVLAGAQIEGKLPPLPDGCPSQKQCVSDVSTKLGVDKLLFAAYLKDGNNINVVLSYVGSGEQKEAKFSLGLDASNWNDEIRTGLDPMLPRARGGKKPLYKRWWVWAILGGAAASGGGFLLLQPTLGFAR